MNQDSAFTIGKSHEVCQDYARTGEGKGGVRYAILCDGCSSSRDSDVGARIMALSAEECLRFYIGDFGAHIHPHSILPRIKKEIERIGDDIIATARQYIQNRDHMLEETPDGDFVPMLNMCLDATVLIALADKERVLLAAFGDGVLALVKSGQSIIHEVSYPSGYPCYLSYRVSPERQAKLAQVGGPGVVTETAWGIGGKVVEERRVEMHKGVCILDRKEGTDLIAVASDGVQSFIDVNRKSVSLENVLGKLLAFKGTKGRFVQRRLNGFKKLAAKEGWEHHDDLSLAAISLGE